MARVVFLLKIQEMESTNQKIGNKMRAILKKKEEENRALLKLIRALEIEPASSDAENIRQQGNQK